MSFVIRKRWPDRRAWSEVTRRGHQIENRQGLVVSHSSKKRWRRRMSWSWGWSQAQVFHPSAPPPPSPSPCSLFIPRPTTEIYPWKQGGEDCPKKSILAFDFQVFHSSAILRGSLTTRGILKCREGSLETPSLTMGEKSKVKCAFHIMPDNLYAVTENVTD